jgi:hypothetical protein
MPGKPWKQTTVSYLAIGTHIGEATNIDLSRYYPTHLSKRSLQYKENNSLRLISRMISYIDLPTLYTMYTDS